MSAPWAENSYKVVVEFLKSGSGAHRTIHLKHTAVVPPQLQGRVSPTVWQAFMADIEQAAREHPYVVKPSAGRVGSWVACGALAAVIGCCAINPDGGDYNVWLPQVQNLIDRHQPAFAAAGCQLSLQRAQQSHWIQIDVSPGPSAVAVGQPVAPMTYPQGPNPSYPQEPQKPGYEGGAKPGYEGGDKPPY